MQPRGMRRAWRQDMKRRKGRSPAVGDRDRSCTAGLQDERYIMETETLTRPRVALADSLTIPGAVIIGVPEPRGKVRAIGVLTRDELQAIVQQAYDRYGVTADPFATPGSFDFPASALHNGAPV